MKNKSLRNLTLLAVTASFMKSSVTCVGLLVGLMATTPALAQTVVPTDWWSNRTAATGVEEFRSGNEAVRLSGGFSTGEIEGVVQLPSAGQWQVDFFAHTDETVDVPSEFIRVFVDGVLVQEIFNTPPGTNFQFEHLLSGDQFTYRFEFFSPSLTFTDHMVMDPGTVSGPPVGTCTDNAACSTDEYCAKEPGQCESAGSCSPIPPIICAQIFDPVCGCDGTTYASACDATAAGVNIDHQGACPGLAFVPASQTVEVGQSVSVDIVVSGLGPEQAAEIIGAFDLDIQYDPAILSFTALTFGDFLANGAASSLQASDLSSPGMVDLAEVSLFSDPQLEATQPASFVLATLTFEALAAGTSPLTFVFDHLNDVKGLAAQMLLLETQDGSITVVEPTLSVLIDIKPDSFPNSINPRDKGVIPVAILTTSTTEGEVLDFDAITVDPLSVRFGPNEAAEAHRRGHLEDVDGDGDIDLMLHFRTQETGVQCGDTSLSLTGETLSGQLIEGSDSVRTVGCK